MTATLEDTREFPQSPVGVASGRIASTFEALGVLASPAVLYVVLRLRGMAPTQLPDPSMHTTFIVDPHDILVRYQALFTPTSRLREAARVGFLVPARAAYLMFGSVPGFFVFRYLLALVAIVPVYLLLKKLYGRWAGFVGIAVVMSSPVVITAWGTDYPDSGAVSYLTGGLAALALSWEGRRWIVVAGGLFTLAVWSHGASVPLVAVAIVVYLALRIHRARRHLAHEVALLVASAIAVTGLLAICSWLLLGQFDFITPTLESARYLSRVSMVAADHSASWSWAPYDPYLLVPPAIVISYLVVFARGWRNIGSVQLLIGITGASQLVVFAFLQFASGFQSLEMFYFSSTLWSVLNIMLAMIVAELTRLIVPAEAAERSRHSARRRRAASAARLGRTMRSAVPALLVLAVAWAYEAADGIDLHVPAMMWAPWGAVLAAIIVGGAVIGRLVVARRAPPGRQDELPWPAPNRLLSAGSVIAVLGAALVLTVAPDTPHGFLPNTVHDPTPAYASALGGDDTAYVAEYAVVSEIPQFVGPPAHSGELLLTWTPTSESGDMLGPTGMYHAHYNAVSAIFPMLGYSGVHRIETRHASQVLIMSLTGRDFAKAVRSLRRYQPVVVRRGVLSHGSYHLHLWLVDLMRYYERPASTTTQ